MTLEWAKKRKESEIQESFAKGKAAELRKELVDLEESGIGFPFGFAVVETLHEFQHDPMIAALIEEKQGALKMMLEGIEREIELGYFKNDEREQKVYSMLKKLVK